MSKQNFRVGGSGYTVLHWKGSPLLYCRTLTETPPRLVGGGTADIQGIDDYAPREIVFARAAGSGSMTLEVFEKWEREVWEHLSDDWRGVGIDNIGAADDDNDRDKPRDTIVDLMKKSARDGSVSCFKIIKPPGRNRKRRKVVYHGAVITDFSMADPPITVGTMEVIKTITVSYTHSTRSKL